MNFVQMFQKLIKIPTSIGYLEKSKPYWMYIKSLPYRDYYLNTFIYVINKNKVYLFSLLIVNDLEYDFDYQDIVCDYGVSGSMSSRTSIPPQKSINTTTSPRRVDQSTVSTTSIDQSGTTKR
jgi:hypothetical protein